jgi:hypothetical protein
LTVTGNGKTRPDLGPGELFCRTESIIAVADIDPAVARKLPAAVVRIEVMAMPVMAMAVVMVMAVMVMAMVAVAVMAVAVTTVMAVTTMLAAGEGLARDGQRTGRQRQSRDSGHNSLHDLGHEHLLGCAGQGSPCDDPT